MYKKFIALLAILSICNLLTAQIEKPVSWQFSVSKPNAKAGETVDLIFKGNIKKGWHFFSNNYFIDPGPTPFTAAFTKSADYELIGTPKAIGDLKKYDDIFEGDVKYFEKTILFHQKVKLLANNAKISGTYDGQACTDNDGVCVQIFGPFTFTFDSKAAEVPTKIEEKKTAIIDSSLLKSYQKPVLQNLDEDSTKLKGSFEGAKLKNNTNQSSPAEGGGGLFSFFIQAFLGGLIALLTPCVYPIIPMTVSFFTKQKKGISLALLYGFFIVAIYVLFGTIISFLFGQTAPNFISTHWFPNILFFLVFVVFGLSFLGWFEITLPNSVINKMDANADKGGIAGVFFMAFTLVLVSFSCTGPIAGTILGLGAQGQVIKPIVGMLGFSLAFAIPFTLFAIFPSWLHSMPKSGGWLNSVKVVLGFLELALALKFLSTADQVYHWHILDRETYLVLWIAIFGMIGLYLIGKISLPHDSKTEHVSIMRILFAIGAFAFTMYLIPGLWGAPLKVLSGWLPPLTTFDSFGTTALNSNQENTNKKVKYGELFKLPHNLTGFFRLPRGFGLCKIGK